jgi:porin
MGAWRARFALYAAALLSPALAGGPAAAQEAGARAGGDSIWTWPSLLDGPGGPKAAMRADGVSLESTWTQFDQALWSGDGSKASQYGGKFDVVLTLDGQKLGLWSGLSINLHQEFVYGDDANNQGDGTFIPVNTALAFPRQGGSDLQTSLVVTQKLSQDASLSLGKFNMLDAASRTPLLGGGGLDTFMNLALAAPASGVTPPYILGGSLTVKTAPATFNLLVYDPRNAEDFAVLSHPFADGVTASLSATVPIPLGGLPGFHTFRGVYSTKDGVDLRDVPQLILPPGFPTVIGNRSHYWYLSYSFQQFLYRSPADPRKGWGVFGEVGVSDGNPNPIESHYFLGLGGASPLPGRTDDGLGLAYFSYALSSDLRQAAEPLGLDLGDESGVEVFYNLAVTRWFRVTADLQDVSPFPRANPRAVFGGLRTQVRF